MLIEPKTSSSLLKNFEKKLKHQTFSMPSDSQMSSITVLVILKKQYSSIKCSIKLQYLFDFFSGILNLAWFFTE